MEIKEQIRETAFIATILGDHFVDQLYPIMQERGTGYISTAEEIVNWSLEFFDKHNETNWEDVLENGMSPLSTEMQSIICYDDAIIDFGYWKLCDIIKS
ncbi:MAG: hypothetical protein WCP52_02125 [Bacteroidota bacterium]